MLKLFASDKQAVVVLIGAVFAFKADELDAYLGVNDPNHVAVWNRYIDHAHMFFDHLSSLGVIKGRNK